MKIAVPRQREAGETRVALVPAAVKRLVGDGIAVAIESGAGAAAHFSDGEYIGAGGKVMTDGDAGLWSGADLIVMIGPPTPQQIANIRRGAILIGTLAPLENGPVIKALAERGVTSFSLEFIPRISRAQAMDVLSSQTNIGGYKAALLAAEAAPKMFPMMMTAAGTIAPAKVFVLGAGVAGLQAIATAKRMGAVVEAYDVRPAVKEQVQSLGARFVELPLETKDAEAKGGYAKEMTDEQRRKQSELMAQHVIAADAVIATAAVFGKAPPLLIPKDVVAQMRSGAVIVDMAANPKAGRGNCELTKPNERITTANGVRILGDTNLPALVPVHASQAYANNILALLKDLLDGPNVRLNLSDEIQKGAVVTHDGKVVNEMVRGVV